MLKQLFKHRVAQNASWIIGGKIAQMIINFVIGLLTARYLGPANYGLINYAAAYTSFFASVCTLGINSILVKELIDHPDDTGEILGSSLFMRVIASVLSAISIIGLVAVLDRDEPTTILIVALATIGMVFHSAEIFHYFFQAKLQSKITSIASLIAYVITAVYRLVLLITQQSVIYFALATAIDYICVGILLYFCYHRSCKNRLRVSLACCKWILSRSWHFILPGLMVSIYSQTDKLMLKQMISNAEIGYYATAVSLATVWCFVLSAIIDSFYPIIMEAFHKNQEKYERYNKILYAIIFYVSTVVSLGFVLLARPIVHILYGEAYLPTVSPLRIIVWYTSFSYLGMARNAWVVSQNKQKYLIWIYASSALINVALNLLFIPHFGAMGAAVASLIAQMATTIVVPFFIRPLKRNSVLMLEAIIFKGLAFSKKQEGVEKL